MAPETVAVAAQWELVRTTAVSTWTMTAEIVLVAVSVVAAAAKTSVSLRILAA